MLDLTGLSDEMFRYARKGINARVSPIGKKTVIVKGQEHKVTVYSIGIADGGRLGHIPENPNESEENNDE